MLHRVCVVIIVCVCRRLSHFWGYSLVLYKDQCRNSKYLIRRHRFTLINHDYAERNVNNSGDNFVSIIRRENVSLAQVRIAGEVNRIARIASCLVRAAWENKFTEKWADYFETEGGGLVGCSQMLIKLKENCKYYSPRDPKSYRSPRTFSVSCLSLKLGETFHLQILPRRRFSHPPRSPPLPLHPPLR